MFQSGNRHKVYNSVSYFPLDITMRYHRVWDTGSHVPIVDRRIGISCR